MIQTVLSAYAFPDNTVATPHGSGLINRTWTVQADDARYILQQVNEQVFTDPALITQNIDMVGDYLSATYPGVVFPKQVRAKDGRTLLEPVPGKYFRLFPFVEDSRTVDVVDNTGQAKEAARQFGRFTHMLAGFPATQLKVTLPHFHDLSLRYRQFVEARSAGNPGRIAETSALADWLESQSGLVKTYEEIITNPEFRQRVTHHDTKISNILFDREGKGICVIDLDTVMPGYFISDVGDMFRTYLSPVSEEENDLSLIRIREPFFEAIVEGYLFEMHDDLTAAEKDAFVYSGSFIIYMQALRFLTDYLNNDRYYGSKYPEHNFMRAKNQAELLRKFLEAVPRLKEIQQAVLSRLPAGKVLAGRN